VTSISPGKVISTILKHDSKQTSYKIALLRAINDVVLAFPELRNYDQCVAVPLRRLAEFWIAYYWPFVEQNKPILQGARAKLSGELRNDIAFRNALTDFRQEWEKVSGGVSRPADGFFVINELCVLRKRRTYPPTLLAAYERAIKSICKTLEMPIRYAGPGEWGVFSRPNRYSQLSNVMYLPTKSTKAAVYRVADSSHVYDALRTVIPLPGMEGDEPCLILEPALWRTFRDVSLWVEALCIHEWCLFTENVQQGADITVDRGDIYRLLTDRPDNRRPLTWERNQVELLMMEGKQFICPWTEKVISLQAYDMDHLMPLSVYPINELWNLIPSDSTFNCHVKRNRLPSLERLERARPHLELAYAYYNHSHALAQALAEDVSVRFLRIQSSDLKYPQAIAAAVIDFIDQVSESRNLARF
jgi:HNH endonuclease